MMSLRSSLLSSSLLLFLFSSLYAITPPPLPPDKYLDVNGGPNGVPGYVADDIGWRPDEDLYLHYSSGWNRHLSGDTAVRSIIYNYPSPYGWGYRMDSNILYMGKGGFIVSGTAGMWIDGGYLKSLVGTINISLRNKAVLRLETSICDNGNIKTGLNIIETGLGMVHLAGKESNVFTGEINISGSHTLSLEKTNGAVAVSGKSMYVKNGAKVVSCSSGQIAKHVHVTLESSENEPTSQLILGNGVREEFNRLTIDGKGIVEFKGASTLIIDDLDVSSSSRLTVVGWEHGKDLFLVRKTSAHVKIHSVISFFKGRAAPST